MLFDTSFGDWQGFIRRVRVEFDVTAVDSIVVATFAVDRLFDCCRVDARCIRRDYFELNGLRLGLVQSYNL